jgi:hypothetical protein
MAFGHDEVLLMASCAIECLGFPNTRLEIVKAREDELPNTLTFLDTFSACSLDVDVTLTKRYRWCARTLPKPRGFRCSSTISAPTASFL